MDVDLTKSLEQIEESYWGPPTYDSYVVTTCHHLRTIPLKELSLEHIRLGISQRISVPILVPLALPHLECDPLVLAELYEGDLLEATLKIPDEIAALDEETRSRINAIFGRALKRMSNMDNLLPFEKDRMEKIKTYLADI